MGLAKLMVANNTPRSTLRESARSREFRSGCGMPDRGDAAFHLATIDLAD
jgi:hypothetical protein